MSVASLLPLKQESRKEKVQAYFSYWGESRNRGQIPLFSLWLDMGVSSGDGSLGSMEALQYQL